MGVYDNRARRTHEDDVELIVRDNSTTITRTRETHPDPARAPVNVTVGPYAARIEQFKATRSAVTYDEKGTGATAAYVLVALNRPALGATWTIPKTISSVKTFKVDDELVDADGNRYRITSPARWLGNVVELNIELLG